MTAGTPGTRSRWFRQSMQGANCWVINDNKAPGRAEHADGQCGINPASATASRPGSLGWCLLRSKARPGIGS